MPEAVVEKRNDVFYITPSPVTVKDVFEYAKLLIETYGWNDTFNRAANGDTSIAVQNSSTEQGYTLHDALNGLGETIAGRKDWSLRQETVNAVSNKVNSDDKTWENQQGRTQQDIINLLNELIDEETQKEQGATV